MTRSNYHCSDMSGSIPIEKSLSKEQFYKRCHISKATALRLIRSGLVQATKSNEAKYRYSISASEVERYLADRERHPNKYGYAFNTYGELSRYSPSRAAAMRRCAAILWADEPPLLRVDEAARLIGYRANTVYNWLDTKSISVLRVPGKIFVPKTSLIDFIATPAFHSVKRKSQKHYDLIRRALNEGK